MKILLLEEYLSEQEFRYTRSQGCQFDSRRDGFRSRHRDTLERQANVSETLRSEALCSDELGHCAHHTCSVQILFDALLMLLR